MLEDPITLSAFLAGIGVLVLLAALILRSVTPGNAQLPGWFAGGVVGIFLGAVAAVSTGHLLGYVKPVPGAGVPPLVVSTGMGGGGGPPGGGMGGMGGGMMGMGSGGAGSARTLTALVGKLNLLCDGVRIELSPDQQVALAGLLTDLDAPQELAAADADARREALESVLTVEQRATIESIELPRARPGGGSGGGGPGGMGMAMTGGGPGGMAPDNKNPFQEGINAQRLNALRSRLAADNGTTLSPSTTANAEDVSQVEAASFTPAVGVDTIDESDGLPVREDIAGE